MCIAIFVETKDIFTIIVNKSAETISFAICPLAFDDQIVLSDISAKAIELAIFV